jgi:hypothetical protein
MQATQASPLRLVIARVSRSTSHLRAAHRPMRMAASEKSARSRTVESAP